MTAIWNGAVLAESDKTIVVEGNYYFPPDSVNRDYVQKAGQHTTCPWKGQASYYNIEVDGQVNREAAWSYPQSQIGCRTDQGLCRLLARRTSRVLAVCQR